MRTFNYSVVDVFTTEKYKGNPLSVVQLEGDLDFFELKNIAREFGYAKTSFVSYDADEKVYKVRSLTPGGIEVSGAGHNLLGAVCHALLKGQDIFSAQQGGPYVIMKNKKILVSISYNKDGSLLVTMKQQSATVQQNIPKEMIAGAIGLTVEDLAINNWEPTIVKTEVAHLMVPVKNSAALNQATSNKIALSQLSEQFGFQGAICLPLTPASQDILPKRGFLTLE